MIPYQTKKMSFRWMMNWLNTDMITERYTVFKESDLHAALSAAEIAKLRELHSKVILSRHDLGKAPFQALIVESDWPEYSAAFDALTSRIAAA